MLKVVAKHCASIFAVTVNSGILINSIIDIFAKAIFSLANCKIQQIT